jgi:hypothetical protein
MRTILVALAGLAILAAVTIVAPVGEARPPVACTQIKGSCPGYVCADENLDGRFTYNECVIIYCVNGCCGEPCPPPPYE